MSDADNTIITKIKRKGDSLIEIHTERELAKGRGIDARVLKCTDEPYPSFSKAMDALEVAVRSLLEILPEQWDRALGVSGVSFSETGNDGEGVVITSQVTIAGSENPLVLNTPMLPVAHLAETAQEALKKVRTEAAAYLKGKRRGDLFAPAQKAA